MILFIKPIHIAEFRSLYGHFCVLRASVVLGYRV